MNPITWHPGYPPEGWCLCHRYPDDPSHCHMHNGEGCLGCLMHPDGRPLPPPRKEPRSLSWSEVQELVNKMGA